MIPGILTQEEVHGAPGYTTSAVHFAGSIHSLGPTGINITSLSCGTDNGLFAFSFWAMNLIDGSNTGSNIWMIDPAAGFDPWSGITGANSFNWVFSSLPGYTHVVNALWRSNIPDPPDFDTGQWNHYLGSADTNQTTGKVIVLYVNDILITRDSLSQDSTAFIVPCNGKRFLFGDDTFGGGPTFDCADLWMAPNIKLHDGTGTIPTATRRQFISATGHPVNPTGWPASAVQCYGNAASFGTNHGTGGVINVIGTLTNAATHP